MARSTRVFVSYARFDEETDRVSAFVAWLRELSGNSIDFVMDTRMKSGDDIKEFERSIQLYSRVLLIGTSTYKKKVEAGEFGVSREFRIISELHSKKLIRVFCAVMENDFQSVFPDDSWSPLANYFLGIVHDHKNKIIPSYVRARFLSTAKTLVADIQASDVDFSKKEHDLDEIKRNLIFEPKHENLSARIPDDVLINIFVKTSFYYAAVERNAYLFIGRKGSGKSFLTDYFTRIPQYKNPVPVGVHLSDYNLSSIYNLRSSSRLAPDIGGAVSQRDLFRSSWVLFFACSTLISIYASIRGGDFQYDLHEVTEIAKFAQRTNCIDGPDANGNYSISYTRLLNWCIEEVFEFVDVKINNLTGAYAAAISELDKYTEPKVIVSSIIGAAALSQFQRAIHSVNPTFLITVDGFDSKFDRFRRETNTFVYNDVDSVKRVNFELDWLCGLIDSTDIILNHAPSTLVAALRGSNIRFLVTLPRDRFAEILYSDRDAYRLRNRQIEIRWTGMELMNLVRKRLENYYKKASTKKSVEDKFYDCLKLVGDVPNVVQFELNKNNVSIDIFLYLLRHTFWRPRDILYHAAELISLGDKRRKFNRPIAVRNIREMVKSACKSIIRDEFISEFRPIFPDIQKCILSFTRQKIEMHYSDLYENLSKFNFRLSSGDTLTDVDDKLDFLYEIGFIGVVLDDVARERRGVLQREAFSFSCKLDIRSDIDLENRRDALWCIHPIFAEYLELDYSEAPFLLHYKIEDIIEED